MLATSFGSAAAALGLYFVGQHSFALLAGLIFVFEGLMAPLYGLGVGQTSDYIEKKDFVAASSGLLFAWGLGSAIGPALAGGLIGLLGPRGLFLFMAGALAAFIAFLIARMLIRRAKTAKDQLNYVAVPLTQGTYGAPELDPRGEPTHHPHRTLDE
jgi:MFS family permease